MKYIYQLGLAIGVALFAAGCTGQLDTIQGYLDEGETIYAAKMDSIHVRAGQNRVQLVGVLKYGMDTKKCIIRWMPGDGALEVDVNRVESIDTFRVSIDNLPEGTYSFEVVTLDKYGNRSISTTKGGKTYGDRYIGSLRVRNLLNKEINGNDLMLSFASEAAEALRTKVFYLDSDGKRQEKLVSKGDNQLRLPSWKPRSEYEVKTYYVPEPNAVDTFTVSLKDNFPERIVGMDKSKLRSLIMDNDIALNAWGGALAQAWDNNYGNFAHSDNTHLVDFPAWFTFDLGEKALLKRFDLYPIIRADLNFNGCNMRQWEIWGRTDEPANSSWDGWTKLTTYHSFKPSGKPVGENTEEDVAYIANGEKFEFPTDTPEVRYIRIKVLDSCSG